MRNVILTAVRVKIQWYLNPMTISLIQENKFEFVICRMRIILFWLSWDAISNEYYYIWHRPSVRVYLMKYAQFCHVFFWSDYIMSTRWFCDLSFTNVKVNALGQCMMTSSNGNVFRATGPLWGESTSDRWIRLTKASDAELWCFLWSPPEHTIEQPNETQVIWEAILLIITSLLWAFGIGLVPTHNNIQL